MSWDDPVNANGIIRKYHIKTYDTKTGRQVNSYEIDARGDAKKQRLISSLKPFTNYTFTIQAVTIKAGEMANLTARTKEGGTTVTEIFAMFLLLLLLLLLLFCFLLFPSCFELYYENETKCKVLIRKICFHLYANKTNFLLVPCGLGGGDG